LKSGLAGSGSNTTKKKFFKVSLFSAVCSEDLDRARIMLDTGVDIESEDYFARRSLHEAVSNNELAMAEMLLEKGADVNAQDHEGYTPLTTACVMDDVDEDMVKLLLERKADAELKTRA
jgi:ankyrin repeat protein